MPKFLDWFSSIAGVVGASLAIIGFTTLSLPLLTTAVVVLLLAVLASVRLTQIQKRGR